MGRALRFTYAGALHHVTMRCNNKEFLFDTDSLQLFFDVLQKSCDKFSVRLHNYCLMTNHVHLLFEVPADGVLSPFMHGLANVFAKRFNALRQRKGHLWEDRFRSTILEAPAWFLRAMAYIDLNPVRARMVTSPAEYRWSGHQHLAAEDETIIRLHSVYLGLGPTRKRRYAAYSEVLRQEAERAPYSLAKTIFVGRPHFVWRMQRRFGMAADRLPRAEVRDVGDGMRPVELRASRKSP